MQASSATPLRTAWSTKRARFAPRKLPCELGDYLLIEHIGRGGMADIYLAERRFAVGAARVCAVKEIIAELRPNERFMRMLGAEARLVARLRHPNIVGVECLDAVAGAPFMVMEYVDGLDLRELLRRATERRLGLPLAVSITILCELLRGLDCAHRAQSDGGEPLGVVHRDVSPSNVLLGFDGQVKLCDFGIAASVEGVPIEAIEGKAGYMSPEHARGEAVDARADLFAVGIMLWELVSGRRLYQKASGVPLLVQARQAERPPLPVRGLPEEEWLHAIIERALAVDRGARYGSARELLSDLEDYALDTRMLVSTARLGAWLRANFEADALRRRSEKARVAAGEGAIPDAPSSQPSFAETPQSGEVERGSGRDGERDAANEHAPEGEPGVPSSLPPSSATYAASGASLAALFAGAPRDARAELEAGAFERENPAETPSETPGVRRISGERLRAFELEVPGERGFHDAPTRTAGGPNVARALTGAAPELTETAATREVLLADEPSDARRERTPAPGRARKSGARSRPRGERAPAPSKTAKRAAKRRTRGADPASCETRPAVTESRAEPHPSQASLWRVGMKYALTAGVVTFVFLWWMSHL